MQLDGRVAFVTGASSGIGQAAARIFAREGAKVGLMARHEGDLDKTRTLIEGDGGEALVLPGDVSKPEDLKKAYETLVGRWGRLDVVHANAGTNGTWAPVEELTDEVWETTMAVNLSGTFYTVKYAVPYLKRQGGSVVVTASVNGTRMFSNTGATAYATTKAGQTAMAKMLALELAPHKVRVNVICPGAITTEIDGKTHRDDLDTIQYPVEFPRGKVPLTGGKYGTAEQVARLVLFLASDLSDHVTGTEVWIDGAQSLLQG